MKPAMKSLAIKLKQNQSDYRSNYALNVAEDINWILKEADEYFTVDTLAKKYFTQQKLNELEKLKRGLTAYIILEQFRDKSLDKNINGKLINIDRRYINFLASLTLETNRIYSTVELPHNLNIITWNYDMQMELAFARYLKTEKEYTDFDNIVSKNIVSFPLIEASETDEEKLPNLVHLNGVAGLFNYKDNKHKLRLIDFLELENSNEAKTMNLILEHQIAPLYFQDKNHQTQSFFDNGLTFAWEKMR